MVTFVDTIANYDVVSPAITHEEGRGVCFTIHNVYLHVELHDCGTIYLCFDYALLHLQPYPNKLEIELLVADETIKLDLEMNK